MIQHLTEKAALIISENIVSKKLDIIGINILFAAGTLGELYFEWVLSGENLGYLMVWVIVYTAVFILATMYLIKKVGIVLPIFSVIVYCFIDCQICMIMQEHIFYWGPFPLSSFLKWKSVFVIFIIYLIFKILKNKIGFNAAESAVRGNKHIFNAFQLLLLIGAVVWGELVYVIDTVTLSKLPQCVLWIIAVMGLVFVICAGYGIDKKFDAKIFFGVSPLLYIYKAFSYLLFPENFEVALTAAYPWLEAMGYKIV